MVEIREHLGREPVLADSSRGDEQTLGQLLLCAAHPACEASQPRFNGGFDVLAIELLLPQLPQIRYPLEV